MSTYWPAPGDPARPGGVSGPSTNGRGSESWCRSWTHLSVDRRSTGYCRVTFDHPPSNTITATTVEELVEIVDLIEQDRDLGVVVFDSANPDFYLAHCDVEHDRGRTAWLDLLVRLSRAPVVSIASIRGRARGAGSEFVLACDLRFASRENTGLGQVGRGRALEILLVADEQLDDEVDRIASRLARFDHEALARTKSCLDRLAALRDA
jgi:enoyl-CoA hydratase/isomerase-like protein